MLVRVLSTFDFISILLNIFLVLVIKIIIVVVGSVEFIMSLVCCKFQSRRKVNNQNVSISVIIRVIIGESISCSVLSRGCEGGISVAEIVFVMIIAIGIIISEVISATFGGFILSFNFVAFFLLVGVSCICFSIFIDIVYWRLLIIFVVKQLIIFTGIEIVISMMVSQSMFAWSNFVAAIGFGCGGIVT